MKILLFLAILSGAGLALAWHYYAAPLVSQLAGAGLRAAFASRGVRAALLVIPFAAIALFLQQQGLRIAAPTPQNPALDRARDEAPHDLDAAVAQLAARLQKEPDDREGWNLLARSYALMGEKDKAAEAARRAAALDPSASAKGESLVAAANGTVTPEARRQFEAALAADPKDPRARFFMGLAEAQDGNTKAALARWRALEADSPPDAPWREGLETNIARLTGGEAAASAAPAPAAAPGPSAADIAAAGQMSSEDRSAMIHAMVQRLADRLEKEPGDVDGWLRLGRAYAVLGEKSKSLDAFRRAADADPSRADAKQAYDAARAAAGGAQ